MANRFGLKSQCIEDIVNVLRLHSNVDEALIFGSRAMGTYKRGSDIDIALKGNLSVDDIITIRIQLDELPYAYMYDIVDYHKISNRAVKAHIDELGISLYKRETAPKDWIKYRLAEVTEKIGSGATPRGGKETYLEKGEISLIRSQNVHDFRFFFDGIAYISESQADDLRNVTVKKGDVLLNITGDSVARVCQAPLEVIPARVNQHVALIRPNENVLSPTYLKYYMLQPSFKNYMLGLSSAGATRKALTKGMIENFEVLAPEPTIQKSISDILSSLDDKIELNAQMNQTLESMAQAIFTEWFVNFNFPGFDGKLVDGLPKGWKETPIGELFEYSIGGDWGKDEQSEEFTEKAYVIRGTDFNNILNGDTSKVPIRYIKKSQLAKKKIEGGEILLEISGGSKDQPTGRTILFTKEILELFDLPVVPASFCRLIKPLNFNYSLFLNVFFNIFYAGGGTREYQNQSTGISNFQFSFFAQNKTVAVPSDQKLLERFSNVVKSTTERIHRNIQEIKFLVQVRGSLLPRLMTGKIEVN